MLRWGKLAQGLQGQGEGIGTTINKFSVNVIYVGFLWQDCSQDFRELHEITKAVQLWNKHTVKAKCKDGTVMDVQIQEPGRRKGKGKRKEGKGRSEKEERKKEKTGKKQGKTTELLPAQIRMSGIWQKVTGLRGRRQY